MPDLHGPRFQSLEGYANPAPVRGSPGGEHRLGRRRVIGAHLSHFDIISGYSLLNRRSLLNKSQICYIAHILCLTNFIFFFSGARRRGVLRSRAPVRCIFGDSRWFACRLAAAYDQAVEHGAGSYCLHGVAKRCRAEPHPGTVKPILSPKELTAPVQKAMASRIRQWIVLQD